MQVPNTYNLYIKVSMISDPLGSCYCLTSEKVEHPHGMIRSPAVISSMFRLAGLV